MRQEEKVKIAEQAFKDFKGQFPDVEKAIGMLMIGDLVGWRVLYLVHEKRTLRKYEKLLGISVREAFPERGEYAHKSIGLALSDKFDNFWKLVKGETSREGVMQIE